MDRETEEAIDEVLDGRPRAAELAEMVAALRVREQTFVRERDAAPDEARRKDWEGRLREVRRQIAVLQEERAITEFVENEVRAAASRPPRYVDLGED